MADHGVFASQQATSVGTPIVADCGIPFVIGAAPVQSAENPATYGKPVLATSWDEAVEQLGYSDDWESYPICEFMYSQFKLFQVQPVCFYNVLDPDDMTTDVEATDYDVTNHKVELPYEAIASSIEVATGAAVADTDYEVYYDQDDGVCVVELLEDSAYYSATSLSISYTAVSPATVDKNDIIMAVDEIDQCMTELGYIPDLIVAPGYSGDTEVAAVMAAKAANINGLFWGKALIDLDTTENTRYTDCISAKNDGNFVDENEIVLWPCVKLGEKIFHMSTQWAGLMGQVDSDNGGVPYESPSNKNLQMDSMCLADGTEVSLTWEQANVLNKNGIGTALNFMSSGWVAWGNYTACYPSNTDVKDYMIPISRMFTWVATTVIRTTWSKLDKPMIPRLVQWVQDTVGIWLDGIVAQQYLLGGRIEFNESENPSTDLMAGIIKFHIYITPPSPMQECDYVLEYDVDYLSTLFAA